MNRNSYISVLSAFKFGLDSAWDLSGSTKKVKTSRCEQQHALHPADISAAAKELGCWLLSEQSDREANECWLNRWVVTLLHWRGFTRDMVRCLTKLVGWQKGLFCGLCFVFYVNLLCTGKVWGVGDTRSPRNLDWCLHRSSTALASFHWHFMTNQNVSVRPPHASSGTEDVSLNELQQLFFFFLMLAHLYWPGPQRQEVVFFLKKWN